ncbi:MAG TPA: sugar ABC transporter permease [Ardenticatenaceae bacterium]|nr:sugar ABC transporter permease [Ardenticatenaceae bacterium]
MARMTSRMRRDVPYALLFLAPSLTGLLLFMVIPVVASLGLAFTDWNLLSPPTFVGLQNFQEMAQDRVLWISLRNSLYYAAMLIPGSMAAALILALALNREFRGVTLFRLAFLIPGVASLVANAMVWRWLYNDQFGLINAVLRAIGLPSVAWLSEERTVLPAIVIMNIWSGMGFDAIIYLAALRNIPRHLYEAAQLDGANTWQRFWKITFPLLTPVHFYNLIISLIGSFQVFDVIFIMTQGGPGFSSRVYAYHLFLEAFRRFNMGYAAAMAWFLFVIIFTITVIQWRVIGRRVEYDYV